MPPKRMTSQVEVMQLHRLKFKRKESNSAENCSSLTWLEVKEHKTAWAIIKIGKLKELRLISYLLPSKNVFVLSISKEVKHLKASMSHSDKVNLRWYLEIHSFQAKKSELSCLPAFAQTWALLTTLWIFWDTLRDWRRWAKVTKVPQAVKGTVKFIKVKNEL